MRKLFLINFNSFFFFINLIILLFLLSNAENAPLFNLDFSDWYLDKAQRIAQTYKEFTIPGYDYSVFNGWNSTYGSIPINHIMVFFNLLFSPHVAAQLFIFFTDIFVFYGFYFTLNKYFKFDKNLSSLLSFFIYFLILTSNENYIINQYVLFGFLLTINLFLTKKNKYFYFGIGLLIIYCSFSYPPYNIPIAPLFHLIFILLFFHKKKESLIKFLFWFFVIWFFYFIYHASLIISLLENYQISNRFLFDQNLNKTNFDLSLKNPLYFFIFLIFYIFSKKILKDLFICILIIFLPELISILNLEANFILNRVSYSSSLVIIFYMIYRIDFKYRKYHTFQKKYNKQIIFYSIFIFSILFSYIAIKFFNQKNYLNLMPLTIFLFYFLFTKKNKVFMTFLNLAIIIFLYKFFTLLNQGYKSGFLYVDNFNYPVPNHNYRIVSLNDHCFETIFNSSQILIRGYKSLDGNSVFYPKDFANKVLSVKNYYESCSENNKFKYWNNRVFFTHDEYLENKKIYKLFINNNVRIIRSRKKIDDINLRFLGKFHFYNTSFLRYKLGDILPLNNFLNKYFNNFENKKIDVYIYEIKNWKKINSFQENNKDNYLNLKIINFYILIISLFFIIYLNFLKDKYKKKYF